MKNEQTTLKTDAPIGMCAHQRTQEKGYSDISFKTNSRKDAINKITKFIEELPYDYEIILSINAVCGNEPVFSECPFYNAQLPNSDAVLLKPQFPDDRKCSAQK
ncbi:MAG: hypothetical protein LBN95_09810 [Prevotellaceae bacterium]|jgi:hypothetical protein|nr:hypothetical protein [Prevotellaceae bacterium]